MFRRRHKPSLIQRVRQLLWPRSGWRRAARYAWRRLVRLPGSPYSIAAGFACGAAASFTPLIGLHLLVAFAIAWAIGGNVLAAFAGTAVGNPWTFPVIWMLIYEIGIRMGGGSGSEVSDAGQMAAFMEALGAAVVSGRFAGLGEAFWPIFLTMLVGSIPTAIVVWFVFYLALKPLVAAYKNRRRGRQ